MIPMASVCNPLLVNALYNHPTRLVANVATNGAVSVNATWEAGGKIGVMYIEQQRYGADMIQAGVCLKRQSLIDQGLLILQWGFNQEIQDGSFPRTGDPFHSTSFFVEAGARSLLLLREYDAAKFASIIAHYKPMILASAQWLNLPTVSTTGQKNNAPYTHRRFLLAAALGQTAALIGKGSTGTLYNAALKYALDGAKLQTPDGVNPEKGGSDVSYQAVGLCFALRYVYAVTLTEPQAGIIRHAIVSGLDWILTKVDSSGNVDTSGDTRTGTESGRSGTAKTVDYKNMIQALVYGGSFAGNSKYLDAATRIAKAQGWI